VSKSTPDDLAVAFRSLQRRRREALEAAEGADSTGSLAELDRRIAAAAALLGAPADPDAVADAIASRPTEAWDEALLDQLRQHATEAGTAIRRVIDAAR
jgi:hypothetical protein